MIAAFFIGLICGLALGVAAGVAAVLFAIFLIDPSYEGDAIDKGNAQ